MEYSAALYMRLSKQDGKKDFGSIGSQKKLLRRFAAEKGFSVFDDYIDDGFSGTNFEISDFNLIIFLIAEALAISSYVSSES